MPKELDRTLISDRRAAAHALGRNSRKAADLIIDWTLGSSVDAHSIAICNYGVKVLKEGKKLGSKEIRYIIFRAS